MNGYFITFEGGEGAGKSTLIDKLADFFISKGREVLQTHEPGGTQIGTHIRTLLLEQTHTSISPKAELFLFLADRAEHVESVIKPALKAGTVVLCDRFCDSTIAYQGAARKLDLTMIKELCNVATSGLEPDLTLFLDLNPELGLRRVSSGHDRIEREKLSFHQKVREGYLQLAKEFPGRIKIIDAALSPEEVFEKALSYANI